MSMRASSRPIFNKDAGVDYMRAYFPRQLALHLTRPLEASGACSGAIYHLYYDRLMADPIAQMKQLYTWLGDPWSSSIEAGMHAWLSANPQGRFGTHRYSLSESGFTKRELEPYFSDYLRVHPVATSSAA
jgi:hypothetical protein